MASALLTGFIAIHWHPNAAIMRNVTLIDRPGNIVNEKKKYRLQMTVEKPLSYKSLCLCEELESLDCYPPRVLKNVQHTF
jgi:hypothetical protein